MIEILFQRKNKIQFFFLSKHAAKYIYNIYQILVILLLLSSREVRLIVCYLIHLEMKIFLRKSNRKFFNKQKSDDMFLFEILFYFNGIYCMSPADCVVFEIYSDTFQWSEQISFVKNQFRINRLSFMWHLFKKNCLAISWFS